MIFVLLYAILAGMKNLLTENYHASLPEKAQHYLGAISQSIKSMGVLIDDLLQFSRSRKMELRYLEIELNSMISKIVEQLTLENADRIIEWIIPPLPLVKGDPIMLGMAWMNLLDNAVKFTSRRTEARIDVLTDTNDKEFVFGIRDNGIGFEMKFAGKLFGVFQRLHPTDQFEGTGIGLANVKRIILRHGGRVWAESEVNIGTTFYFTLPK